MRSHLSFVALLSLFSLRSLTVHARRGLDPEDIHLLTRGTDYTFHSICADYKNPDLFFDEWELARAITAITNDLNMYMSGFSSSSTPENSNPNAPHALPAPLKPEAGWRWDREAIPAARGRKKEKEREKEMERGGRLPNIDCKKFQRDLRDFATSFQKMAYAISEKCYRQCEPRGYVADATASLQRAFESHYRGGFYRQIREIEAETGCRFQDTFLIEAERAVDYSKIWVETVQRVERPCWALGM